MTGSTVTRLWLQDRNLGCRRGSSISSESTISVTSPLVGFFNPIDDKVFVQVGRLSGLQLLYLDGTSTSDAELAHLKSMTRLSFLSVRSTQISDAGLECLKALTQLSFVDLHGTRVTDVGVKELQQALPNLTIER